MKRRPIDSISCIAPDAPRWFCLLEPRKTFVDAPTVIDRGLERDQQILFDRQIGNISPPERNRRRGRRRGNYASRCLGARFYMARGLLSPSAAQGVSCRRVPARAPLLPSWLRGTPLQMCFAVIGRRLGVRLRHAA